MRLGRTAADERLLHDGQSYDLDELWRFHEKLKGARIARKDWKDTVRDEEVGNKGGSLSNRLRAVLNA